MAKVRRFLISSVIVILSSSVIFLKRIF